MKTSHIILIALGIAALLIVAMMLIPDYFAAEKSRQESARVFAMKAMLSEKLEAYDEAHGHYPASISELSFTNSPQEIEMLPDIRKVTYWRTQSGYGIRYDGEHIHTSSVTATK